MVAPETIEKLTELFTKFPGIGPRQAKRFVYHLLHADSAQINFLSDLIKELKRSVEQCRSCFRFFPRPSAGEVICGLCQNPNRDETTLMVVEKDIDLDNIERSGTYRGYYFVLGGLVPILAKNPEQTIRVKPLLVQLENRKWPELKEIIVALSANEEGDNTADFLKKFLGSAVAKYQIKLSTLGRGLSTGTELEYSDSDTLKNALKNRY